MKTNTKESINKTNKTIAGLVPVNNTPEILQA